MVALDLEHQQLVHLMEVLGLLEDLDTDVGIGCILVDEEALQVLGEVPILT